MQPSHLALSALLSADPQALLQQWRAALPPEDWGDAQDLTQEMNELRTALVAVLHNADAAAAPDNALSRALAEAAQARALRGQSPESSVRFVQGLRSVLLALVEAQWDAQPAAQAPTRREVLSLLHHWIDRCTQALVTHFVSAREQVIRSQAQSLLEMSTPVITLWDSILLLPLVGVVDSVRAVQIAERLLERIGATEAEVTLIDVTGVPVMDTSVARHLMRTVTAAEMLGTRVILTGISPHTAQTIVRLGIDMSHIPTRGTLKAGIAHALQLTGRQMRAQGEG